MENDRHVMYNRYRDRVFIHPNPGNPDRYVVVWTGRLLSLPDNGLSAGFILPVNLPPDYVVVRGGKISQAGHFDTDWQWKGGGQ